MRKYKKTNRKINKKKKLKLKKNEIFFRRNIILKLIKVKVKIIFSVKLKNDILFG
jgi:hypothetical protein